MKKNVSYRNYNLIINYNYLIIIDAVMTRSTKTKAVKAAISKIANFEAPPAV